MPFQTPRFVLILSITVALLSLRLDAQWALMHSDADRLITKGSDFIYNTEFDSATTCFQQVIQRYPNYPAGYFMEAMVDWWRMQIDSRNKSYDESFLQNVDKVVQICDRMLDTNAYDISGLFFKGGILGYRGRYYASNQSWLRATNDAREALDILLKCNQLAPQNYDIMLGTGIYNYFAAALPERYPALKPIMVFLPSGDKKIGVLQLEAAAKRARYAAVEAKVTLQMVYGNQFEHSASDYLRLSTELYKAYPKNASFHRKYATALLQSGYLDSAETQWHLILADYRLKKFGYDAFAARDALYYLGYFLFNRAKYDEALQYFYKCDEACRLLDQDPSGFMVKLNLYVGKIYDIQGKRSLAISQYNKVMSWDDIQNSHDEAKQYLQKAYVR